MNRRKLYDGGTCIAVPVTPCPATFHATLLYIAHRPSACLLLSLPAFLRAPSAFLPAFPFPPSFTQAPKVDLRIPAKLEPIGLAGRLIGVPVPTAHGDANLIHNATAAPIRPGAPSVDQFLALQNRICDRSSDRGRCQNSDDGWTRPPTFIDHTRTNPVRPLCADSRYR